MNSTSVPMVTVLVTVAPRLVVASGMLRSRRRLDRIRLDEEREVLPAVAARSTAAFASTTPKPYSWLKLYLPEAPYLDAPVRQPPLELSVLRAEAARISFTSRQVSAVLAARTRATTPETMGAAADVPPKWPYRPLL